MLQRWPGNNDSKSILNHYFYNGSRPRCYMVNTLSKLWWLGKKTYIDNEENPYIMLDYISHDINGYAFTFFGSNWSNSEKTLRVFFDAIFEYDQSTGEKVGRATKDYISAALEKNCPDRRKYSGRPIFYCITVGKDHIWKIANEYLVRENMRIRKKLMEDQISMLSSNERPIFNLITAINGNKFKLEDLYQFSGQMAEVLPSDQDIKLLMKGAVSSMREKGLLELVDNDIIKKAYSIKIN